MYRADVPYYGAGGKSQRANDAEASLEDVDDTTDVNADSDEPVKYKLQSMKWGRFKSTHCIKILAQTMLNFIRFDTVLDQKKSRLWLNVEDNELQR